MQQSKENVQKWIWQSILHGVFVVATLFCKKGRISLHQCVQNISLLIMNCFRALYHAAIKRKYPKTDLADKSLRPRIGLKNIFKPLLLSTTTSIRFQIRIEICLVHNKLHSINFLSKRLPPGSSLVEQAEF